MRYPLLLSVILVGCSGSEAGFQPSLSFLSPEEGSTLPAGDLQVSIVVEDFELVPPETASFAPARGPALPLWMVSAAALAHDEEGVPSGFCELSLDGEGVGRMDSTQWVLPVSPGPHTLEGELRFADGDPLEEPVVVSVAFTAE